MHESLCFSTQSVSTNLDDLPLLCDGCETVSCVVGSCSDHVRIGLGSCSDRFRIVNGVSTVFRACVVDRIPLWFATVGSFPQCKWGCKWCWWMSCRWNSIVICNSRIVPAMQVGLQVVLVDELPMEFWRKSRTKCVFERKQMHESLCFSIQSASTNLDDLPLLCDGCETVSCVVGSCSDHVRIGLGSCSDRFRIVNGVSTVFRACVVDRIPLWFATVGSFPQCKWGCKWCWWMSCRWNSIVICNSRIVPAMQVGLQVVLVEELPMELWRKSRTKCVFER